jgi:hypothetical protein
VVVEHSLQCGISQTTYAERTDGIDKSELNQRKTAAERKRCAWPGNRNGAYKTMDCVRWARMEVGMAPVPKAKEYQKLKIGADNQEEDWQSENNLYTTDDSDADSPEEDPELKDSSEPEVEHGEEFSDEESEPEKLVSLEK